MIKNIFSKIGMTVAGLLFAWSVWQHELLLFGWIWEHWNDSTQFFTGIRTTNGVVYDFTLLVEGLSFLLLGASLWFWDENENVKPK